ncbi:MAG: hypothetical protein AB7W16_24740 [Candidatus Obscuribacterales bacterium]
MPHLTWRYVLIGFDGERRGLTFSFGKTIGGALCENPLVSAVSKIDSACAILRGLMGLNLIVIDPNLKELLLPVVANQISSSGISDAGSKVCSLIWCPKDSALMIASSFSETFRWLPGREKTPGIMRTIFSTFTSLQMALSTADLVPKERRSLVVKIESLSSPSMKARILVVVDM